jgi:ATP-dependent DNA helicase RecG
MPETASRLRELRQALDIEKSHRFIDVRGKRQHFSQFAREVLLDVARTQLEHQEALAALIQRFERYGYMDLAARISTLEATEEFLLILGRAKAEPRQRTASQPVTASNGQKPNLPLHQLAVSNVRGVGPRLARLLQLVGVQTVEQLLYYFPHRYLDYHRRVKIQDLEENQDVTVMGTVLSLTAVDAKKRNLTVMRMVIADDTGRVTANWFFAKNQQSMLNSYRGKYQKGTEVMLSGRVKWDSYYRCASIDKPQVEILSYGGADGKDDMGGGLEMSVDSLHAGRVVPVYGLTEGLSLRYLRQAIYNALQQYLQTIRDPLPEGVKRRYGLLDLMDALQQIHFPDSMEKAEAARKRLVFDELFYLQARLALLRANYKHSVTGLSLVRQEGGPVDRFLELLPFQLTGAQKRAFGEICTDLASTEPMYRLLHGDVGSGKTVLSALTLLMAVENGYQGALMAPTEILAEQHYRKFVEWLTPLGIRCGLFVGKSGQKERRELRQSLLNGQIHIAIGTHALIQDDVEFANLGVVVVDEQHRFGVKQRTQLRQKGNFPEMLTMTATPIPRTLTMTLHGDLDVSMLDELPPGRTPIQTVLLTQQREAEAHRLIRHEVSKGRQVYIVMPLIEESESETMASVKAATVEAERLQNEVFKDLKIGLLHGKMKPDEKDAMMADFVKGGTHILVSTTVVEVGVDVPNATVILIENADRFGLAQLHQLRGRVGRGKHQSYCLLLSGSKSEETLGRLQILVDTANGFEIAEKDLEIRGPGEYLGTRQSGLPDLVLADLIEDRHILEMAREAAQRLIGNGDGLMDYPELKDIIIQKTENAMSVMGSG